MLTVEIEHIDADALEAVQAELGVDVEPLPATLRVIQVQPYRVTEGFCGLRAGHLSWRRHGLPLHINQEVLYRGPL